MNNMCIEMASIFRGVDKYLEKVNCLVACLKCEDWIINADDQSIDKIFKSAIDIERTLSTDEARNLKAALRILYPGYDFTSCGELVLKTFLIYPNSNDRLVLSVINKYVETYSKSKLCSFLSDLLQTKRLKEESISLINKLVKGEVVKMFEPKSVIYLWEDMIAENNDNFESCLKDIFECETSLFLECLKLSSKSTGHLILTVILRHLNSQPDLKYWFVLCSNKNIKLTSYLCSQYPELMEGLLKFFTKYASEAESHEGESFSWAHNRYPLNGFIEILNFLLTNDGIVGITVNDFINREINNFDVNFSFWLDVKTLLL